MFSLLNFSASPEAPSGVGAESVACKEQFLDSQFKFALQKNGELTELSLEVLGRAIGRSPSTFLSEANRQLYTTINNQVGVVLARNKSICQLVAQGSVDAGIVGIDQVIESGLKDKLVIVRNYRELAEWKMVLATPTERFFRSIAEINIVATQYPVIAQAFFEFIGYNPQIIKTEGSTEVMPLLRHEGNVIDGIIDLYVTGATLSANGLQAWNPAVTTVYPVLVANPASLNSTVKNSFFQKFISEKHT